jgi:hypothetical protein
MTKNYSDEELFTGQNAFYSMAIGTLMLMDPIYLMLSPIHSQYVIAKFVLLTIYAATFAYTIKSFFKYILKKNSKGHYGITLHAESDEYFDAVRNFGYKQSFQFNLIFTFFVIPYLSIYLMTTIKH